MPLPRSRRLALLAGAFAALVALLVAWRAVAPGRKADAVLVARVKRGDFRVAVTTTGELRAQKFVQVQGPPNLPAAQIYQPVKITSLVPEGTVVKEGDVVAELDRGAVASKMNDVNSAVQKAEALFVQAQLDSTLNLSKAREEIRTLEFGLEEKRLAKEQATFEAPTIRRQAEIDLQKADRALAQARRDYQTKSEQARQKMREVSADLDKQKNQLAVIQEVLAGFTIKAPSPGMVIYAKEWGGRKKAVGSQVSPWEPTVATLPDLSKMESLTYVNEIDVRKLAVGQPVTITLDADPTKRLRGKVTAVANVGEQRPNSDAKVFEVKVDVQQPDTTLRPGMTTSNAIETAVVKDARFIPLEALVADGGRTYVFRRAGGRVTRQQVETGVMNENEVIVTRGLDDADEVLLAAPADASTVATVTLPAAARRPADTVRRVPVPAATPAPAPAAAAPATKTTAAR